MSRSHSTPWKLTPARVAAYERRRRTNSHRIDGALAYILLTDAKGQPNGEAVIDREDLDRVLAFGSWHRQDVVWPHAIISYAAASVRIDSPHFRKRGQQEYMHRVIMDAIGDVQVDHWNGDGLNNRKENLRLATNSENGLNRFWHRRIDILEEALRELRDCDCTGWCVHREQARQVLGD